MYPEPNFSHHNCSQTACFVLPLNRRWGEIQGCPNIITFLFFHFPKKFFREVNLCTIFYNSWKFDPDWFSNIGDHRYRMTGFAIPLEPWKLSALIRSKCGQGGGGQKHQNFADVIYGSSLQNCRCFIRTVQCWFASVKVWISGRCGVSVALHYEQESNGPINLRRQGRWTFSFFGYVGW